MKDKIKKYNTLLDDFLDGSMCMDDQLDFIEKYKNDPIMIEQFNRRKEMQQALTDEKYDEVSKMINEVMQVENNYEPVKKVKLEPYPIHKMFRYAAVLLILLGVGMMIARFTDTNASNSELTASYFEPYEVFNTFRNSETTESDLATAFTYYQSKNFSEAYQVFDQLRLNEYQQVMVDFYKANALMANKDYTAAIPILKRIEEEGNNLFDEPATWYLGLAYLGNDDALNAKKQLESVVLSNNNYADEAAEILQRLK